MSYFYLKQKAFSWTDRYKVYDKNGDIKYYVEGELFSWRGIMHLYDEAGIHLYTFKHRLFSFFSTIDITNIKNGEVTTLRRNFSFFAPSLSAYSKHESYELLGDFMAHQFEITKHQIKSATVHKEWLTWGDTYQLSIADHENEPLMIALIIGIDTIVHNGRYNN